MARTIEEIKKDMTDSFIENQAVISAYGLTAGKTFDEQFSRVSIESILFYVFAAALWSLEKLFDLHVSEVDSRIEQLEPHTLRWYVNKTKAFLYGHKLVADSDYYDTSNLSEADIEKDRVVKYAVASESNTVVYIKVAGERKGKPCPLTDSQIAALNSYINTIKDAGVSVQLRNEQADLMRISLVVYYDPTLLSADGVSLADGSTPVDDTVKSVITNLPFNGVYRNTDLLAALQALSGVEVVDISKVEAKSRNADSFTEVVGFNRPYSGYFEIESLDVTYIQYSSIE
ncbi:hypothetical protein [Segatella sp.]|uniref:hypothetical protein n=2 Tax=Bacteroidales TaxID=171549 RepID=UPI003AB789B8